VTLPRGDHLQLAQEIAALAEPFSSVAAKVSQEAEL
jgi:hypothetical protein